MAVPGNSIWLDSTDWLGLSLRLVFATILGGAIGLNRELSGKAAGLRTHMLVSLGAALFVMLTLSGGTTDLNAVSRSIQGVATGIGFLGAGEIIQRSRLAEDKPKIKGLTSAASVWTTAALGMVAACGLWPLGIVGTLLTLLILSGAKSLERLLSLKGDDDD